MKGLSRSLKQVIKLTIFHQAGTSWKAECFSF